MSRNDIDQLWRRFKGVTRARIGLGRTGDALPTRLQLEFQYAHALARDAVLSRVDFDTIASGLEPLPTLRVHSDAADRAIFLRRPDRGRRLAPQSARCLDDFAASLGSTGEPSGTAPDVVFVIADGLSASAVERHAAPTLRAVIARLEGWRLGPVVLAEQARVALGDEVGMRLKAGMTVMLIGERPGLSTPDSLGIYITHSPRVGRQDAERNCISNIHGDGLSYETAACKLEWLMSKARSLRLTGVALKEDAPDAAAFPAGPSEKLLDSEVRDLRSSET